MYKLDKTYFRAHTFAKAEKENLFSRSVPLAERLNQGWYLSAMVHGLDPYDPSKMEKNLVSSRKHKK